MKKVVSAVALITLPAVALAQSSVPSTAQSGLLGFAQLFQTILGWAVVLLISVAVVYFLYGVLKYVIGSDPESKEKARHTMIYGLIGLAVMVAVWGLVKVLTDTFGLSSQNTAPNTPSLPTIQ
jgi:Kef-type K+ transport system membrane component KefB